MGLTKNPATALLAMNGLDVLPNSAVSVDGTEAGLVASGQRLAILAPSGSQVLSSFEGESSATSGRTLLLGPMSAANLEALRTVSALDPGLFREIYDFSRGRYEEDRASYHVSASTDCAPVPDSDAELPALLESFDAREILHVTFGSVLKEARFRDRLLGLLREHPEHYAAGLERHFLRHLEPFANGGNP